MAFQTGERSYCTETQVPERLGSHAQGLYFVKYCSLEEISVEIGNPVTDLGIRN